MGRLRAWIRGFFGFSRTESNAFLILLPLMLFIIFSEPLYRALQKGHAGNLLQEDTQSLDSMLARLELEKKEISLPLANQPTPRFTFFDPNTSSPKEFENLGLSSTIARRIDRYRKKGGAFRTKNDLGKIYGIDTAWFRAASPWIRIAEVQKTPSKEPFKAKEKVTQREPIDINTCDSVRLTEVPGIGPVLSKRILTFRDRLGGLHSVEQLGEVYGLDSAVVVRLKERFAVAEDFVPLKINVNNAMLEDFIRHPYIRAKEARAIVAYRLQHGRFESVEQLTGLKQLSRQWVEKVRPYLSVE